MPESRQSSGGEETPATATALESFKQKWDLFRVACHQAEELVESIRQRIGSECLVDEATGRGGGGASGAASQGIPPISAVRLEQMSRAVRWLVIDLQHGSGGAAGGVAGGGAGHGVEPTHMVLGLQGWMLDSLKMGPSS
ncbi:hypothetical protein LUZ63_018711 [Rhynchospora breviuscula]|uniref:Uncharacterized protein n=1 Tax=Rhynchospora breviuscula TaxID=2022672 RepID=A0A9Q0C4V1_9POAL|nr:hypothetical protein LUZ63_018711 [Rhynchospora breviuscula]